MATKEEDEGPELVSEFPNPPAYFELYADGQDAGPIPPTPMSPTYHMFGTPYSTKDVVPDLLPQEEKKLYLKETQDLSAVDFKHEIKKLNASLLANFTELIDILMVNPAYFNEKLSDLELLFLNLHNLINAFRPHQARETLIEILRNQIQERQEATSEIQETIEVIKAQVEQSHEELYIPQFEENLLDSPGIDNEMIMSLVPPIESLQKSPKKRLNVITSSDHIEMFQTLLQITDN